MNNNIKNEKNKKIFENPTNSNKEIMIKGNNFY